MPSKRTHWSNNCCGVCAPVTIRLMAYATTSHSRYSPPMSSASRSPCYLSQAGHRSRDDGRPPSSLIIRPSSRSLIAGHRLASCGRTALTDDLFHAGPGDVDVFHFVGAKNSLHHVVHGLLAAVEFQFHAELRLFEHLHALQRERRRQF